MEGGGAGGLFVLFIFGYVVFFTVLYVAMEEVRDRLGRVPVIDPAWQAIRCVIKRLLRVPGRVVRWLRPRDTPHLPGGP